jgi:hypothetical protein
MNRNSNAMTMGSSIIVAQHHSSVYGGVGRTSTLRPPAENSIIGGRLSVQQKGTFNQSRMTSTFNGKTGFGNK